MAIESARDRGRLIVRYSLIAGLGWMLFQVLVEVLFGSHISLARTLTVGSGVGAAVGLLTSSLQWLALRRNAPDAGSWIPVTTVGCTLGGIVGGFSYYMTARYVGPFDITIPSGGIIESLVVGLIVANCQRIVLRKWVSNSGAWVLPTVLGMGLGLSVGWLVGTVTLSLLHWLFGLGMWPLIMTIAYALGGIAGGAVFAACTAWALHRILPTVIEPNASFSVAVVFAEKP